MIAYLRATSVGVRSGSRLSPTISRVCSAVHLRRPSPRVMISIRVFRALLRLVVRALPSATEVSEGASPSGLHHNETSGRHVSPTQRLREEQTQGIIISGALTVISRQSCKEPYSRTLSMSSERSREASKRSPPPSLARLTWAQADRSVFRSNVFQLITPAAIPFGGHVSAEKLPRQAWFALPQTRLGRTFLHGTRCRADARGTHLVELAVTFGSSSRVAWTTFTFWPSNSPSDGFATILSLAVSPERTCVSNPRLSPTVTF